MTEKILEIVLTTAFFGHLLPLLCHYTHEVCAVTGKWLTTRYDTRSWLMRFMMHF